MGILGNIFGLFVEPILRNLVHATFGAVLKALLPSLIGGVVQHNVGDSGGGQPQGPQGPQGIDLDELRGMQGGTQGLIDEQLGISRGLMDPNSQVNQQMKNLMAQRASETGAQTGSQALKIAAMKGVSPGQALMQQRMAQNQAMGGVNQDWQQQLQGRFGQGLGLMGNMTQMQQGMDENMMNAYLSNVQFQNQQAGAGGGGAGGGLMGMLGQFAGMGG